jgi:HAMP domain-containing protein
LAAAAGWLLASFTTKPMRRMTEVAGVDGGDLIEDADSETRNDEVRRLAESFNGMHSTARGAFTRQRAFVADAFMTRTP